MKGKVKAALQYVLQPALITKFEQKNRHSRKKKFQI